MYSVEEQETTIYLGGADDDHLFGDEGNDTLYGSDGDDYLYGSYGKDILDGGAGDDHLFGGYGNDTYLFDIGSGLDVIYDYDATSGNMDAIQFNVKSSDLIISHENNDIRIAIQGTEDSVTIQSWFSGSAYQTEVLKTADGNLLFNTQVEQLIQAMASFTETAGMSWNQALQEKPAEVSQLLAQYWKPQNEIAG